MPIYVNRFEPFTLRLRFRHLTDRHTTHDTRHTTHGAVKLHNNNRIFVLLT